MNKKKKQEKERSLNLNNIYVYKNGTGPFIICEIRVPCEHHINDVIINIDNYDITNYNVQKMRSLLATTDIRSSLKVLTFKCVKKIAT